jgi:hypothetical protein
VGTGGKAVSAEVFTSETLAGLVRVAVIDDLLVVERGDPSATSVPNTGTLARGFALYSVVATMFHVEQTRIW